VEVSARRYRYTGKERDDETGLYYHGARYYAAWLARWTSADPLGLHAGLNLYLYGRASPVVYVDPSGMFDVMAMANLGQTVATNAAFSAADAEARSWAPDSSDSLYAEAARPSTEYDPNAAAAAMAEAPSRSEPTEFTEPGNMGFGTHLVSPGELYEQAQLDAENTWRQGVLERKDYTEKDLRGHKLWTQNPQTGEMDLAPDRYLELPVGTSEVEVQLALGGAGKALGAALSWVRRGGVASQAGATGAGGVGAGGANTAGGGGEMVSLYRAVGDAELGVIRSTGRIPESLSGLEVKYFSATPEGAAAYARQAVRGFGDAPYTLVDTQVPRSALPADVLLQVDRNVPAVVLPNTHLPLLRPANVWPFMPVP
jgi:RHS repeat-associated protein